MVPDGWLCLREVGMDYEADIIVGFLEENNIPAVKHYPEAGEYLKLAYGMASSVSIYVSRNNYAQAKALLTESSGSDWTDASETEGTTTEHSLSNPQLSTKTWGLGLLMLMVLLMLLFWALGESTSFFNR